MLETEGKTGISRTKNKFKQSSHVRSFVRSEIKEIKIHDLLCTFVTMVVIFGIFILMGRCSAAADVLIH